ncbi:conjugal transfer protein TraR [Escherichia coli]|uniref:Conjugal transfer protein TraR n=2 Tax=Enterobacteriaceae TaxID=543 RepID=A0A0M1UIY3_ECOLX|nr:MULTISPECIES: conjugal transfer protein TraR [Enterobacteriaceae]EGE3747713.1 conjugal transfer protein TraR [Shigella boydii]EHD3365589.1 conjugal transfer protein TraR [Escherichia coli O124]EHD3402069.1 conjugal transfer protein TraR [Escherichia coli O152]AKH27231.1 conjugal transfer protein TraR [Escherichia coli]EAC0484090.1 conjugal transfer protein TraR [Escherichia coli]
MSDEADEAYSATEQLTMTGINRIRQKINAHGIPVYLCEACGNPVPEARQKIFPGVALCVECQAYQENKIREKQIQALNDAHSVKER